MNGDRFLGLTIRQFATVTLSILVAASLALGGFAAGRVTLIAPVVDRNQTALSWLCDTTDTTDVLAVAARALVQEQLAADLAAGKTAAAKADRRFIADFTAGHRRLLRNGACDAVTARTSPAP